MITFFRKIYRKRMLGDPIVVISGLPRSGTSMTMKMLEAGGMTLFTDHVREADENNPKGYYEFERVKNLHKEEDKSWLADARGKAVKIISELLMDLPDSFFYQVIFMNRHLEEVITSQNKMLIRRNEEVNSEDDERIMLLFEKHLKAVKSWLDEQSNFDLMHVNYKEVVDDPCGQAERIRRFLGRKLDVANMGSVVDEKLYRNRR